MGYRVLRNCVCVLLFGLSVYLYMHYIYVGRQPYFRYENELCKRSTLIGCNITKDHGGKMSPWKTRLANSYSAVNVMTASENLRSMFKPKMSIDEYKELMDVLKVFVSACENSYIPWMLADGSLLGALRHLGMIPWDDDIDTLFDVKYQDQLRRALSTLNDTSYKLFEFKGTQWKFYKMSDKHKTNVRKEPYPPFIDVFFYDYEQNGSVVRRTAYTYMHYNTVDVFPIKLRPFEEFMLPTPNNAIKILDHDVKDWNHTCSFDKGHKFHSRKTFEVNCEELYDLYPFAFRNELATQLETSLKLSGR